MSKFDNLVSDLKKQGGTTFSRSVYGQLAMGMFNDVELEIPIYVKKGDLYEVRSYNPGRSLRTNFIAPILKQYGVDKAELASLDNVQIGKAGGEALADFSLMLVKKYISTNGLGRKLQLPMTGPAESVQTFSTFVVPEEKRDPTMILQNQDGSYSSVPTGKTVTTASHEKGKATNRTPAWLKTSEPSAAAANTAAPKAA